MVWIMVPAGDPTQKTVEALADVVGPTATIAPTLESFDEAMAADTEHAPTQRSSR